MELKCFEDVECVFKEVFQDGVGVVRGFRDFIRCYRRCFQSLQGFGRDICNDVIKVVAQGVGSGLGVREDIFMSYILVFGGRFEFTQVDQLRQIVLFRCNNLIGIDKIKYILELLFILVRFNYDKNVLS